jgi:hypothetical protein
MSEIERPVRKPRVKPPSKQAKSVTRVVTLFA